MAKKRVHEIAKSQGMTSKEVIAKLQAGGLEVKAAASSVEEADALKILSGNGAAPAAEKPGSAPAAPKADGQAAAPAATTPRPAEPAKPAAAPPPAAQNEPAPQARQGQQGGQPPRQGQPQGRQAPPAPNPPAPGAGPRVVSPPTPPGDRPPPGTGPRIISGPEPAERPKRDESANQPGAAGRRPNRGGMQGERAPGGAGAGGRRRVVIDSQASRRPGGPGGGPGGPGGGPGGPPQQRGPRRRGRRRREVLAEVAPELDVKAQRRTDVVKVNSGSTVKDVAEYLGVPTPEIIKKLMTLGEMATLTQTLTDDAIQVLADEFDKEVEIVHIGDDADTEPAFTDDEADLVDRPPVVTIMGHVDHGKTSLLDAIRETEVVAGEAGGITQHIGAYQVTHGDKAITFLDTPGHEAFTAMRARGARVTDVAVIVVAADDGARPQTDEAIDHAKAAEVPIIVAVNKIDKEGADPTRVRTEMTQRGLQPSEWGGETEFVDVSAKTKQGLDDLLDTILVVAELEELKANPAADASGVIIESKLDPGRGPVATLLIQRGHLEVGDSVVAGPTFGRVRAMNDHHGDRLQQTMPGDPVEVLGFEGVPDAGEPFRVVENDREARRMATERANRLKTESLARRSGRKVSLEDVFKRSREEDLQELALVVKADVAGSLEAIEDEIAKLPQSEIQVNVIHAGVGGINESDVMLAAASEAVILGFNVRPVGDARQVAEREGVDIRMYAVIYRALDELRAAMEGLLAPEEVEETVAEVEVRQIFRASRIGVIAGCYVTEGTVTRGARVRVVRDGTVVYDSTIQSLRRFNDDVREVQAGFECGIVVANFQDIKEGDNLEVYATRQVERELS